MIKRPPSLRPDDEIRLVSTARKIDRETLQPAIDILRSWGFSPTLAKNLFAENHQMAGTDAQRTADFQDALDDKNVRAILCVRGGYGTVRIIDQLNFSGFVQHPKWIAGYSDVTVLHNHIHRHHAVCTLHSTMAVNMAGNTEAALDSLRNALTGEKLYYTVNDHLFNRHGTAEAEVVGGNLSMLYSLMGSPSDLNTAGKILFIEDLDEYLYHVDRMMMNLRRSGKLSELTGLIVGGMTDMRDNEIPFGKTAIEIVSEAVSDYNYPVCFDFPAGHMANNCAIIMGAKAKLTVGGAGVSFEQ